MTNTFGWIAVALSLAACGGEKSDKKKDGDSEETSKKGGKGDDAKPKKLTAPKVETGKLDLTGKCDETYPVDKGDDGKITACAINQEVTAGDVTCAKSSRPYLFDDGTLKNCGVKGVLEAGPLKCHKGVTFHKDGSIRECILKEPVEHDGKKCKTITFKEDGSVDNCRE